MRRPLARHSSRRTANVSICWTGGGLQLGSLGKVLLGGLGGTAASTTPLCHVGPCPGMFVVETISPVSSGAVASSWIPDPGLSCKMVGQEDFLPPLTTSEI